MTMPALVVAPPEPRGLRYGLLTAANGPLDLPPHALSAGLVYEPVSCGRARLYPVECPADTPLTEKIFDPHDPFVSADPFIAYATVQCGSVGTVPDAIEAKVRRRLANGEQGVAEEGLAAELNAGATVLASPHSGDIESVLGTLQQWLYGTNHMGYGNVGYLHAPPRLEAFMTSRGVVFRDGLVWRTAMGTIVVWGGGYPDDGRIFISGQVTVWRNPVISVPPTAQTFDHLANQYYALAEREYAVAYDCLAASALYTPDVVGS